MTTATTGVEEDDRAYLTRVRAEIDEEVRRRRASGDLPPQLESELEALFLQHAPLGSTRQELHEVLRLVDAAAFIDPVVPVESSRPGGAVVKKSIRSMNFWYLRFITHQMSQFTTAVSRSLHILDHQLAELTQKVDAVEVPPSVVVDVAWAHRPDAWWVPTVTAELDGCRRRVLHAACGDGWLVAALTGRETSTGTGSIPGPIAWRPRSSGTWTCARSPSSTTWRRSRPARWAAWCCPGSWRDRATASAAGCSRGR